jgi:small acid-soluble spore protein (thioredoxin-like protein)
MRSKIQKKHNRNETFHSLQGRKEAPGKNERRRKSIDGMKEEMQEEQEARESGYSNDNI